MCLYTYYVHHCYPTSPKRFYRHYLLFGCDFQYLFKNVNAKTLRQDYNINIGSNSPKI